MRFLRPSVTNKSSRIGYTYLCLQKMREEITIDEVSFKKMVELVKGKTNASVPFLNDTSTDTIIKPSMNGKQ